VFVGAVKTMTPVGAVSADPAGDPSDGVAVSRTRIVEPPSALVSTYGLPRAGCSDDCWQLPPLELQSYQTSVIGAPHCADETEIVWPSVSPVGLSAGPAWTGPTGSEEPSSSPSESNSTAQTSVPTSLDDGVYDTVALAR
jgi:hypothetical protein